MLRRGHERGKARNNFSWDLVFAVVLGNLLMKIKTSSIPLGSKALLLKTDVDLPFQTGRS